MSEKAQIGKLRHSDVKSLARGSTDRRSQVPEPVLLIMALNSFSRRSEYGVPSGIVDENSRAGVLRTSC